MAGSFKQLQIKSLNTLSNEDEYIDGSCEILDNLEPDGVESNPKWSPAQQHLLKHNTNYSDSGNIKERVFHVQREGLNTDFDHGSRSGTDYFIVCEAESTNDDIIVSTTTNSGSNKNKLTNIIKSDSNTGFHGNPNMQAFSLRDDQQFILINESGETDKHNPQDFDGDKSFMFMNRGDTVGQILPPTFPTLTVNHTSEEFSLDQFEKAFPLGDYPGILANRDRFIGVIFAYKAPSGEYIKQTAPYIHKIDGLISGETTSVFASMTNASGESSGDTSVTNGTERLGFSASSETNAAGDVTSIDSISADLTNERFQVTESINAKIKVTFKIVSRSFTNMSAAFTIEVKKGGFTDQYPTVFSYTTQPYQVAGVPVGTDFTVQSDSLNLGAGDYYVIVNANGNWNSLVVRSTLFQFEITTPVTNTATTNNRVSTLNFKSYGTDTGDVFGHSSTNVYNNIFRSSSNYYPSDELIIDTGRQVAHNKIKDFYGFSGPHIFITTPKDTFDDALNEGTYYHIANFTKTSSDGLLEFKDNESLIVTKEVMNNDPFSHHSLSAYNTKKALNRVWLLGLVTDFAPSNSAFYPGFLAHTSNGNESTTILNYDASKDFNTFDETQVFDKPLVCYITVTLNIDGKIFTRVSKTFLKGYVSGNTKISLLPSQIGYPDRRATKIEFIATHNTGLQKIEYDLVKHPFLNIAYNYSEEQRITTEVDNSVSVPATGTSLASNRKKLYEPGKVRVSSIDGYTFPLQQTYEVDDMAISCVDNIQEASQSSFGRYPVTVFCQNKIYGFEFGEGGVLFKKLMLISDDYGIYSRDAVTTLRGSIFFLDKESMYVMAGNNIQEAHRPIENIKEPSLSVATSDPFAATLGTTDLFKGYFAGAGDPRLFSDPNKNRLYIFKGGNYTPLKSFLVYDTRYNSYYTSSQSYKDLFLFNSTPYGFKVESNTIKIYSLHDLDNSATSTEIKLSTGFMPFDTTFNYKKLLSSVLQGNYDTNSNEFCFITLQGKRSTHNDPTTLIKITVGKSGSAVSQDGIYIKSNRGSYQSFRLLIHGTAKITTKIGQTLFNYLPRNAKIKI